MRKRYVILLGIAVLLDAPFIKPLFDSDFDGFAKATIKEQGHLSGMQAATDAVGIFIQDNQIEEPIIYFKKAMGRPAVLVAGDTTLSHTDQTWLGDADRLSAFHQSYFNYLLTKYHFSVLVYDHADGTQSVKARITYDAP